MDIPPEPSEHESDGDDFLSDPEQLRDRLPQPFSMIDKVLDKLFYIAWDIICKREIQRIAEDTKKKIPILEASVVSELPERTNCLACSEDGHYLGIGHSQGLSVACTSSVICVAEWLEDKMEITSIQITCMGGTAYLLGTVDDMGVARVFAYDDKSIHLLKVINKTGDINKRRICLTFELSRGGHCGSASISCNGAVCLEVYCFPVEEWLKDLPLAPSQNQENLLEVGDFKWSPSAVLMRVKPPKILAGTSPKSPRDVSGLTLGSGQNYSNGNSQIEEQDSAFKYSKTDGTEELDGSFSHCTTHFLLPCGSFAGPSKAKLQPAGLPVAVALWWSGSHDLLEYFLCKSAKDKLGKDPEADVLWLNAGEILCSAVSSCTRYVALGLGTALVSVRDRQLGLPLSVVSVSEADSVFTTILFVHSKPASANDSRGLQAITEDRVHLLVACKSGSTYALSTGRGAKPSGTQLSERPSDSNGFPAAIASVPFLRNLILVVQRNGVMLLQDVISKSTVSYLNPPMSQLLATPWDPVYALDTKKKALFIQGDQHAGQDASITGSCQRSQLLTFNFGEAAIVEPYIIAHGPSETSRQQTDMTFDALQEACSLYLQQRELSLDERNKTLSQTWKELQQHAQTVQRCHKRHSNLKPVCVPRGPL